MIDAGKAGKRESEERNIKRHKQPLYPIAWYTRESIWSGSL
jgi:hypothetical protein